MHRSQRRLRTVLALSIGIMLSHPPIITAWTTSLNPWVPYLIVFGYWAMLIAWLAIENRGSNPNSFDE